MKTLKRFLFTMIATLFCVTAYAGFDGYNGNTQLGIFNKLTCSTGLTCTRSKDSFTMVSSPAITGGSFTLTAATSTAANLDIQANNNLTNGDDWRFSSLTSEGGLALQNNTSGSMVTKWSITTAGNVTNVGTLQVNGAASLLGGIAAQTGDVAPKTVYADWSGNNLNGGTSTTPSATTLYLAQVDIPRNVTLTGIQLNNAATCGSTKWIVALFNTSGTLVANSNTAGVTCSGTSAFQQLPFTGTYAVVGPQTFWIGLYANNTTDRFYTIPAGGQGSSGLAGVVTGQTFGTVANITVPTTFTAGDGPYATTY